MEVISGLGVDLVSVARIASLQQRFPQRFCERLLAPEERVDNATLPGDAIHLAGRWAAKEAVSKALGSGIRGFAFSDILIKNDVLGKPYVELRGGAARRAREQGVVRVLLSISHEREFAMAEAIAISVGNGSLPLDEGVR